MTATRRGVNSALNLLSRGGEHPAAMGHTLALRAQTAHALVGWLAALPLTVGSKLGSPPRRADFSFVAAGATRSALPLRLSADPEQKCGAQLIPPTT